jgi:hypothetical protein
MVIMGGLLLVFFGVAEVSLAVPLTPPTFPGDIAPLAAGVFGLLFGGILMGYGLGVRSRGGR